MKSVRPEAAQRVIYVIHEETEVVGLNPSERKRKLQELYTLSSLPLLRALKQGGVLFFPKKDEYGVKYPHEDALGVDLKIGDYEV